MDFVTTKGTKRAKDTKMGRLWGRQDALLWFEPISGLNALKNSSLLTYPLC